MPWAWPGCWPPWWSARAVAHIHCNRTRPISPAVSAAGLGSPAAAPVQPWSQGSVHLGDVEDRIWRFTNDVRRQYGLPPVGQEGALSRVSQAYAADMLVRRFFSHTNPEGLTAGERLKPFYSGPIYGWGENIWEGSNLSAVDREALARRIMDAWMSSPGHRQNILSPDYTHLGVGVAASGREIRATQLFATLRRQRQAF